MVRCALTPSSTVQQQCVIWLENHFNIFGDKAPNKDEVHLSVMTKKGVYESYHTEMQRSGLKTVQYNIFVNLWNSLFPHVSPRPWVDVPGKCSTCYRIDRMRKTAEDREVQYHLGLAHQLHRGGYFMLEREK